MLAHSLRAAAARLSSGMSPRRNYSAGAQPPQPASGFVESIADIGRRNPFAFGVVVSSVKTGA